MHGYIWVPYEHITKRVSHKEKFTCNVVTSNEDTSILKSNARAILACEIAKRLQTHWLIYGSLVFSARSRTLKMASYFYWYIKLQDVTEVHDCAQLSNHATTKWSHSLHIFQYKVAWESEKYGMVMKRRLAAFHHNRR